MLATERHFVDHLAPVWHALPVEERGVFVVPAPLLARAAYHGIAATTDIPEVNRPILVAAWGDEKRAVTVGRERIAFLEHGIGQSYAGSVSTSADRASAIASSYPGADGRLASLFMVPNAHSANRWRAAYPYARVEVVGSPKLDTLPHRIPDGRGPVIAFAWHWDARICHETRTAFFEYRPGIAAVARKYETIGHGHPRLFLDRHAALEAYYRRNRVPVMHDFDDVLRRADVLVSDNSSALYEFASTGRIVVVANSVRYRRRVEHGLRFWDAADVGVQVAYSRQLVKGIALALDDTPARQAAREAALDVVYAFRTGAAERAATTLLEWAPTS